MVARLLGGGAISEELKGRNPSKLTGEIE